jgi:hypothetical protein
MSICLAHVAHTLPLFSWIHISSPYYYFILANALHHIISSHFNIYLFVFALTYTLLFPFICICFNSYITFSLSRPIIFYMHFFLIVSYYFLHAIQVPFIIFNSHFNIYFFGFVLIHTSLFPFNVIWLGS